MASVLETFYLMFSSNADELDEGSKKAKDSTDELEESLEQTEQQSQKTGQGFLQLSRAAVGALAGALAVGKVVASVFDAARYADDLRLASGAIGENIEDVDAWGRAVTRFGGTANGMQSTLSSLNNSIRETAFTGEGALTPVLNRLGLSLRSLEGDIKGPLDLLPEIAEAFEGLSRPESNYLGQQLGLDQATITMLQSGRAEVERLIGVQRELGVVTAEDAEASRLFRLELAKSSDTFMSLRQRIATQILPVFTRVLEALGDAGAWVLENRTLMEGLFIGIAGVVTTLYLPAMLRAAVATLAATWPILAIIAVIGALAAAFALVYDEVRNFAAGNDSLIGEAVKKWPPLLAIINGLIAQIRFLGFVFRSVFGFIGDFIRNPVEAIRGLISTWGDAVREFVGAIPVIGNALLKLNDIFGGVFGFLGDILSMVIDKLSWILNNLPILGPVLRYFSDSGSAPSQDTNAVIEQAKTALNLAATSPISAQTSTSLVNSQVRNSRPLSLQIDQLTIATQATDADGIGAAISSSLSQQLQQAIYNFDDGVSA